MRRPSTWFWIWSNQKTACNIIRPSLALTVPGEPALGPIIDFVEVEDLKATRGQDWTMKYKNHSNIYKDTDEKDTLPNIVEIKVYKCLLEALVVSQLICSKHSVFYTVIWHHTVYYRFSCGAWTNRDCWRCGHVDLRKEEVFWKFSELYCLRKQHWSTAHVQFQTCVFDLNKAKSKCKNPNKSLKVPRT